LLAPLFLPDPIPTSSHEPIDRQFTQNLFYTEAIHNQSFWMPPFVDVSNKLKTNFDGELILTNTRIVHVVVWTTGIPMRHFVTEMNTSEWEHSLQRIDPRIRWVITEEGDHLWIAQGKFLSEHFIDVASSKTE